MLQRPDMLPAGPIVSGPGQPALSAVGTSFVIREWTDPGPSYLHIHLSDDEAWHVLEGSLRFRFRDGCSRGHQRVCPGWLRAYLFGHGSSAVPDFPDPTA